MTPDFTTLDTWVLAGQSNMQGGGLLTDALPPDERVWSFTSAGVWAVASEPLHRLWESYTPINQALMRHQCNMFPLWRNESLLRLSDAELAVICARDNPRGAGLGLAFGRTLAEALGRPIGLIPASHGGTTLRQWSQHRKAEGGRSLYGAMLDRIQRAGGRLRGVLWYQGESDVGDPDVATYGDRLAAWIEALRADTGQPDLPVLVVQLGRLAGPASGAAARGRGAMRLREAFGRLPERVPHTACASAIDLELMDSAHIGAAGLVRLGERLATLALRLLDRPGELPGPRVTGVQAVAGSFLESRLGLGRLRVTCAGVTGGWQPAHNVAGFEICTADYQPHPDYYVINADVDPDDPSCFQLLTNAPVPTDGSVLAGYGVGAAPYCNAVDGADLPLCTFLPVVPAPAV